MSWKCLVACTETSHRLTDKHLARSAPHGLDYPASRAARWMDYPVYCAVQCSLQTNLLHAVSQK